MKETSNILRAVPMGWKAEPKAIQAAERRQQREAQKRLRELERQAKEQAKLSAIEQARLEVETFESSLAVLLSVHKEQVMSGIGMNSSQLYHRTYHGRLHAMN